MNNKIISINDNSTILDRLRNQLSEFLFFDTKREQEMKESRSGFLLRLLDYIPYSKNFVITFLRTYDTLCPSNRKD